MRAALSTKGQEIQEKETALASANQAIDREVAASRSATDEVTAPY
jgi:hypothetical protein